MACTAAASLLPLPCLKGKCGLSELSDPRMEEASLEQQRDSVCHAPTQRPPSDRQG
jgi:hypothetical protein